MSIHCRIEVTTIQKTSPPLCIEARPRTPASIVSDSFRPKRSRREFFIGSFNFDPRSANINTELGVIIRSTELSEPTAERFLATLPAQTYEVFLNENGKLRWRTMKNGQEVIVKKEPDTTWWQRFVAGFMRILPIRGQL